MPVSVRRFAICRSTTLVPRRRRDVRPRAGHQTRAQSGARHGGHARPLLDNGGRCRVSSDQDPGSWVGRLFGWWGWCYSVPWPSKGRCASWRASGHGSVSARPLVAGHGCSSPPAATNSRKTFGQESTADSFPFLMDICRVVALFHSLLCNAQTILTVPHEERIVERRFVHT